MRRSRQAFGLQALDELLGGGLIPGTLTVVAGATGVGKTQLGLTWANQGFKVDGHRGVVCDLTSRGDAQNHAEYARQLFDWTIEEAPSETLTDPEAVWDLARTLGDYFHPFARAGRRVTRRDLDPDEWHAWKSDLARVLRKSVEYFYSQFVRGVRRVIVDGIEPTERFSESIQFEFFEYLYHHVLRKEDEWAARELFRELFRANADRVAEHSYDYKSIGCLYLYTTPHVMLNDMMTLPINEGDIFSNANTIIFMGRTQEPARLGRALYIPKHRGSACSDAIHSYRITDQGLVFD